MSMDDRSVGRADLNFASTADIEVFVDTLARFERGEIDSHAWRAFRLINGTYGQRQEGSHSMLRVKIPQGVLRSDQLEVIARVAQRYSRGFAHLTTRQNFQLHFIPLAQIGAAMIELAFDADSQPEEELPPPAARDELPSVASLQQLVATDAPHGPGLVPRYLPTLESSTRFFRSNVAGQKQAGFSIVTVTVPLGDLSHAQLLALAQLARAFSDGTVRTTHNQKATAALGPKPACAGPVSATGSDWLGSGRSRVFGGRDYLSRRRDLQAGGHAVTRRGAAGIGALCPASRAA